MEEEKKEEVKEDIKVEKPKRSTKSKVITVLLCISLFCILCILLAMILGKLDTDNGSSDNNSGNNTNKISYEIKKDEKCVDGEPCTKLYVNGNVIKDINGEAVLEDNIHYILDSLLVVESFDSDRIMFINDKGEIFDEISGKLDGGTFLTDVKNDEILIKSYADSFYQYDGALCNLADGTIAYTEEKVIYRGNGKVEPNVVLKQLTKEEYIKEHNVDCSVWKNDENYTSLKLNDVKNIEISSTNKEVQLNGKTIKFRNDGKSLYINDTKVNDLYPSHVLILDKYLLLLDGGCQCSACITSYIDSNGKLKTITNRVDKESNRQFSDYKVTNGVLTATAEDCPCLDEGSCEAKYTVKFVYENNNLSIVK